MGPLHRGRRLKQCRVMKTFLLFTAAVLGLVVAQSASATDMGMPISAPAAPPVHNWSGFYIGGNFGGGWGHTNDISYLRGRFEIICHACSPSSKALACFRSSVSKPSVKQP